MSFGPKSLLVVAAIVAAVIAAACVFFPEPPKFEEALYAVAAGVGLLGVAHFVRD